MVRELNWAGNHVFTAARIHRPASIDDVRRLVAISPKIRAIGTRHSFNAIADSDGDLVDLGAIDPDFVIDRDRMTLTVGAGTPYNAVAHYLHRQGYALHNLASLPHISVAGAVATGTHGSGDKNGTLSHAVSGLEIVGSDGHLFQIARDSDDFDGIVVGLGAFGLVARVTLDIEPTFNVRQDAFVGLSWDDLLSNFDAIFSAAYSVSVFTKWSGKMVDHLWLKTRLTDQPLSDVSMAHLGLRPGPAFTAFEDDGDPSATLNPFGGVPGPWSERLPHFRPDVLPAAGDQIQSEYIVSRSRLTEALTAIRTLGNRIDPYLRIAEIRTMAADALWLSSAYMQDSVGIHFTWKKEPEAVDAITRELEAMLLPLGARPHWGKVLHAGAEALAPLYPRFSDFRALADRYDPKRQFRNAYLAKHVFGLE